MSDAEQRHVQRSRNNYCSCNSRIRLGTAMLWLKQSTESESQMKVAFSSATGKAHVVHLRHTVR